MANGIRLALAGDIELVEVADEAIAMARLIGAQWVEALTFSKHGVVIVVDEEGLLTHKPVNHRASLLAHKLGFLGPQLVGAALVVGFKGSDLANIPQSLIALVEDLPYLQDVAPL